MGDPVEAGRAAPLSAVPLARRLSGVLVGIAFFVGPVLMVSGAVSARTAGVVDSKPTVEERMRAFLPLARAAAESEQVPLELVLAVASAESSGRPDVVSRAGAVGLMQLLPSTAAELAADRGERAPRLTDPGTSLRLGARYLRYQLRAFDGYAATRELALCAYNAGPGSVRRWLADRPLPADEPTLGTWIPPEYAETRAYVRRVTEWESRWAETLRAPAPR